MGLKPIIGAPRQENTQYNATNNGAFTEGAVSNVNAAPQREVNSLEEMLA